LVFYLQILHINEIKKINKKIIIAKEYSLFIRNSILEKNPEKAMTLAIKGMLPHNSLGRAQLKKLRVYAGNEHENQAQKPEVWEVK